MWLDGHPQPAPGKSRVRSLAEAKANFPTTGQVPADRLERVETLKARYLVDNPLPGPRVAEHWATYQWAFSEQGLAEADPAKFHYFANSPIGAYAGMMTVFNNDWTEVGEEEGARRVREAVHFLLYEGDEDHLAERLTHLIEPSCTIGMKGWKEALLTKVLCVVYPHRFLPIVTFDSPDVGKRALAHTIWGLDLPARDRTSWTIGRLIIWSNDLLLQLVGDGFAHAEHASSFLWDARKRGAELIGEKESPT